MQILLAYVHAKNLDLQLKYNFYNTNLVINKKNLKAHLYRKLLHNEN